MGKVWALQQGVQASGHTASELLLLTDADIAHPPDSLSDLVGKAVNEQLDLVSLMAHFPVETGWERLLIPPYVYSFAKLYPFRWVSQPRRSAAAAAGGCIPVRRDALESAGGIEMIAGEIIDDCALAGRIKHYGGPAGGRIWLGLSQSVRSLRTYDALGPIWNLVARTAFAQLRFSALMLTGTFLGRLMLYAVPPLSAIGGLVIAAVDPEGTSIWLAATGLATWVLMAGSYAPILRWHQTSLLHAPLLTLAGILYTLMTVDSALRWRRGEGGA